MDECGREGIEWGSGMSKVLSGHPRRPGGGAGEGEGKCSCSLVGCGLLMGAWDVRARHGHPIAQHFARWAVRAAACLPGFKARPTFQFQMHPSVRTKEKD